MTGKSLLTLGALTLATVGLAAAKSYDIDLPTNAKAGAVELKPGEYKLKLEGSQAVLTDTRGKFLHSSCEGRKQRQEVSEHAGRIG